MRKEIKYEINYEQYKNIQQILKIVIKKDKNSNENAEYSVKTMYFDNYRHEIENDKKNDINAIKKYRIRMYNNNETDIFLERKTNENGYILKEKEKIKKEDVENILNGDYKNILDENSNLKTELYLKMNLKQFRPVLVIQYDRIAYLDEISKARITLDRNIKSTINCNKFFEEIESTTDGKYILEVKYEKFLPKYMKEIITDIKNKRIESSKFINELEKRKYRG